MRVGTPLGEYPFELRGVERRGRSLAIVGSLAGLESSVVLGPEDLVAVAKRVALPLAAAVALAAYARRR